METFGYIAVYVYNQMCSLDDNLTWGPESFLKKVIESYFNSCYTNKDQLTQSKGLNSFLPSMTIMHNLIATETFATKEITFVKLLLDIYNHYYFHYEKYNTEIIINNLLPACLAFYSKLNNEDVEVINSKLTELKFNNKTLSKSQ